MTFIKPDRPSPQRQHTVDASVLPERSDVVARQGWARRLHSALYRRPGSEGYCST
jgi:hypothetical protein